MNLETILAAIRAIGPVLGALPAIRKIFEHAISLLSEDDQEVAKSALAELRDDNDALHERLQSKLADAEKRG